MSARFQRAFICRARLPVMAATLAISLAGGGEARAQGADDAEAVNEKGKALFKERRYLEAYKAFRQAAEMSPEGRFYFNMCFALNYLERFEEAIYACEQVEPNGADEALMEKTNAVLEALRSKVQPAEGPDDLPPDPNELPPDPNEGPPDPNELPPDPNTGDPGAGTGPAQVPGMDPFATQEQAPGSYAWSIGGGVAPIGNLGIGGTFRSAIDGSTQPRYNNGARLNLFANFMYHEPSSIGLQGYFGATSLSSGDNAFPDALTILDFGGAFYKHFALTDALDLTPLLGLHVALMQPVVSQEEALLAIGIRAQASVDYTLGAQKNHVISLAPTLNLYSGASDGSGITAAEFGLEEGGSSLEISLSYQFRFTTPFGTGPLFTLE